MALQPVGDGGGVVEHEGGASGLADVVNTILDKGLVIDVFARISLVGIELLRIDARIVVAGVDTYLRFAEAANRLGMGASEPAGLPELLDGLESTGSKSKAKGVLEAAEEKIDEIFGPDDDEEEERPRRKRQEEPVRRKERS
jgi:gas vesicle structural protein